MVAGPRIFEPRKMSLGWYTSRDIEELSKCEVTVPVSFDPFCHPIPDGLYDLRMGPLDAKQQCQTCGLGYLHCPGHIGHISLSRVVINPLMYDTLFSILRSTCFHCNFFKITDYERLVYYTRLKALKRGVVLDEWEKFVGKHSISELEEKINGLEGNDGRIRDIHEKIVNEFFKKYGSKVKCPRCLSRSPKLLRGRDLRILATDQVREEDEEESTTSHSIVTGSGDAYSVVSVGRIQEIIERVYSKEGALLEEFYGISESGVYFIEKLCVIPNRFRPPRYASGKVYENQANTLLGQIIARSLAAEGDAESTSDLQAAVLFYFDGSKSPHPVMGLKQQLEKKEGLFRRNIMGKRVNYAARSVISPDPSLGTGEVGVPMVFAKALTFPERVTRFNIDKLKKAVIRGIAYPGALFVQSGEVLTSLAHIPQHARLGLANQLGEGEKRVWRHLENGDVLLVNRQPTLHSVSLMGHTVRVLPQENTLRIHYVNCKPYNADFDGDEMNVHFPQSYAAISEAKGIVHNDANYFLPSSGKPIRGLEQDHIAGAVRLTQKGTFLRPDEFSWIISSTNSGSKMVYLRIPRIEPAILQPVPMYTGKQALEAILCSRKMFINYSCASKYVVLGKTSEARVVIRQGRLVCGTLDKNTLGASPRSLIHACGELYGYKTCNELLTVISRVINSYISLRGFTVRIDDLMLTKKANTERQKFFVEAERSALEVAKNMNLSHDYHLSDTACARSDSVMRSKMNSFTSSCVDLLSSGLLRMPPYNNMDCIVRSGAKGSIVNFSQICCALGQQELEGRRVPIMISGKTLPCFGVHELTPGAAGYVYERFFTGINPATFYFHCMAGREGLVDTAVKTATSGYLQRCLVKHLEGLSVEYDLSVRNSGRVVQFCYGEDGLDCVKESYLSDASFFASNLPAVSRIAHLNVSPTVSIAYNSSNGSLYSQSSNSRDLLRTESLAKFFVNKRRLATVDPGMSVGVLAAQSIGEPSTQMTLNTFHLAGVGNLNVTLGIPRLSEIVMTASKKIKTPFMTVAAASDVFRRVTLDSCLSSVSITELTCKILGEYKKRIKITFDISEYENDAARAIDLGFLKELGKEIKKRTSATGITESALAEPSCAKDDSESSFPGAARDESESDEESVSGDAMDEVGAAAESEEQGGSDSEGGGPSGDEAFCKKLINLKKISKGKYVFTIDYPSSFSVWLMPIIESICRRTVVREIKGLCGGSWSNEGFRLEGSDFPQLVRSITVYDLGSILDIYSAYTNDIYAIYCTFGIEAARSAIVREITSVFDAYGISINIRHLYLVADYMTRNGMYESFSRNTFTMDDSFLQRMSFESSFKNLKTAALFCDFDVLKSPSSCITLGNKIGQGTGAFEVFHKLEI